MVRIRKPRLAPTSSGKPELHESSNGGLHLHAGCKSNPSFQDPRSSLVLPASIIFKQDPLLLTGSGFGATHILSQKQLPAEAEYLMRKPYIVVSSGVESWEDGKGLMMKKGEGIPRAKSVMDVQHHEVKHMHMHDDDDKVKSMEMKGCKELVLLKTSGEGDKLAEVCKKATHDIACKGSALYEEINARADPALVVTSDHPRKVRPLQLILSSNYSPTAPKLPLPMCPTSSSSAMLLSSMPLLLRKFDKASPCTGTETPPLPSPAAGPIMKQINADTKLRDEMRLIRHEHASRSSQNGDQSLANLVENRAEFESRGLLQKRSDGPVSSWQGHRRPRSHGKGGRGSNGSMAGPAGVNAVIKKENTQKNDPTEQLRRKKPKQTKRKAIDILFRPCTSVPPAIAEGNGELMKQDCPAAPKNKAHTKKTKKEPLLLSASTTYVLPISSKMISSLAAAGSSEAEHTAAPIAAHPCDNYVASIAPTPCAAASDHGLQIDSMRCRRKDGRRWRCKEQVVKAGAPFCHYHTIKMREKHAASVARKLLKQLQGEVTSSFADFIRSSKKRANKRRKISSSPVQEGYSGGCKVTEEEEEHEEEEEEEEREENENDDEQQKVHAKFEKQQLVERLTLRRRWRKKCKPCIRRLHDIHERARPAATDGVDLLKGCGEWELETSNLKEEDWGSRSPLPECLLNTDPYEWRSDFP